MRYRSVLFILSTMLAVPAGAQTGFEVGAGAVVSTRPDAGVVVGPSFAWRPGRRDRLVTVLALGTRGEGLLARAEALWQVHFDGRSERSIRPYVGGGLAVETDGARREWLIVALGVEAQVGSQNRWNLEVGWGGGLRLAAGFWWHRLWREGR